jgi:hypothetical protein
MRLTSWNIVPDAFRNAFAFTVGTRVFIKPSIDPNNLPLRVWIEQAEMAYLLENYGFAVMVEAQECGCDFRPCQHERIKFMFKFGMLDTLVFFLISNQI